MHPVLRAAEDDPGVRGSRKLGLLDLDVYRRRPGDQEVAAGGVGGFRKLEGSISVGFPDVAPDRGGGMTRAMAFIVGSSSPAIVSRVNRVLKICLVWLIN